jgi:6-phosphofructokinase 1
MSIKRNKLFNLIVVAEGNQNGDANTIANLVKEHIKEVEVKVTIIGHLQRGGSPTCQDRVLASRLGASAVGALLEGHRNVALGVINNKISMTTFEDAINRTHELNKELVKMTEILAM